MSHRVNLHVCGAPVVAAPVNRNLDRGLSDEGSFHQVQCCFDNQTLHRSIVGFATRIAQREIREREPWNGTFLDDVSSAADDNRWYSGLFDNTCNQTHGLVTHRSKWDQ